MSNEFNVGSSTVGAKGLTGKFDLATGETRWSQDIKHFQAKAKQDKEFQEYHGIRKDGYRKVATIPDALALKLFEDHNLDIHDPGFMSNPDEVKRLKKILLSEYRDLVINQ